jgi:hypothetical protein
MMKTIAALVGASMLFSQPLSAEVIKTDNDGFVTRDAAIVETSPKATWMALISPARWWNSGHTWSGDAANLRLTPQAGGCFCERIPENPDPERITLEGSVEHMRVIHAFPENALRMRGSLGPLQSEAASGVLTVALSEHESGGTRIVWEYVVGGYMRYDVATISKAVDGVMSQQLNGLADMLGRIDKSAPKAAPQAAPQDSLQSEFDAEEEPVEETAVPEEKSDREKSLEDAVNALADEDS